MTDPELNRLYIQTRNALDALKTASLEPVTDLQVIASAGSLVESVGRFVDICLNRVYDKLICDLEETNK